MRTSVALTAVLAVASLAAAPLVAAPPAVVTSDDAAFVEVVFDGPAVQADRDLLDEAGATAVTATGADRYRAAVSTAGRGLLAASADVVAVRELTAEDKVHAALRPGVVAPVAIRSTRAAVDAVSGALRAAGGVVAGELDVAEVPGMVETVAVVDRAVALQLAAASQVAHVGPAPVALEAEDERSAVVLARLVAEGSDATIGPAPGWEPRYEEWLAELGIDGSGVNVSVVDTGIDEEHPDLNVVGTVDYAGPHDEPVDVGGHGTHVGGIIAGTGAGLPDAVAADPDGYEPGMGVAPGAGLLNQNVIGRTQLSSHVALFEQAVADAIGLGANIWNASWTSGEGTNVGYLDSAARLDALIRDGDPEAAGTQRFVMVFSAGNSGTGSNGEGTLTAPKEAKNLIVVASVDSPTGNPVLGYSNDPRNVTSFSSRGPTVDGRIGPTVAAPGADVRSTRSLVGSSCNTPVEDVAPGMYSYCSGTSMAAPHVAGSAALVTQWWREGQGDGTDPSAALVKALLVNSAVDIGFPDVPNINEGWGRVDLDALFRPDGGRLVRDRADVLTDPGQTDTHTVEVDGTSPLRVTVAWDDVPGDPSADRAIVSDLDLVVTAPDGTEYLGNVFETGRSTTGGEPDRIEVLENVVVPQPAAGTWTVEVRAHALPADGAIGSGDGTDQDYALVVTGTD